MNNILKKYTNMDLLQELLSREKKPITPKEPVTPYSIMCKMIEKEWHEDSRLGYSNKNIDAIWNYLGYPKFTDDMSYCAATVNVCLKLAGYKTSESIPVARSFEYYGKKADPIMEGDIVVFRVPEHSWKGHVGFVKNIYALKQIISVAGGNQDNKMCFKDYDFESEHLKLSCVKNYAQEKIGKPDYQTLQEWGLL